MDTIIQLGSFVFQDLEIPEKINFGGTQQLVQHDLIGGNRVIDALGKNDSDISWSGLMTGATALPRAQQLNQLRVSAQQLSFKFFNFNYTVIIQSFTANTERYYQVNYDINLKVISDNTNPVTAQNLVGFNEAINGDFNKGNAIATSLNIPAITTSMSGLNTAISNVSTFNGASQSTIAPVVTAVNNAITAVSNSLTPIANRLFGTNS